MTHQTANVMVVKAESLKSFPKGFQNYVNEYFSEETILGMKCYIAFRTSGGIDYRRSCHGKGVALSHSVDMRRFKVSDEEELFDWLNKKLQDKDQTDVFEFRKQWDDGCISPYSED